MLITEIRNEKALEMLGDVIEPLMKIMGDPETKEHFDSENMLGFAKFVIKKFQSEIIEILAAMDGVPVAEYDVNIFGIFKKVMEILNTKELTELFTSAGQTAAANSSTSLSENTEGEKQ